MTIWTRISDFMTGTAASALGSVIEQVRTLFEGDPETRARVSFSIAMIALSAKMAKADGVVTKDEVDAFKEIFEIPDEEAQRVSNLYNLARQDVAGFESYAAQLANLCGNGEPGCLVHRDILDGLFHIAKADGVVHEKELEFLQRVAEIFGLSERDFDSLLARHVDNGKDNPWRVLGIEPSISFAEARTRYLALVQENHPDRMLARGVPEEFLRIANERLAAINHAWDQIKADLKRK